MCARDETDGLRRAGRAHKGESGRGGAPPRARVAVHEETPCAPAPAAPLLSVCAAPPRARGHEHGCVSMPLRVGLWRGAHLRDANDHVVDVRARRPNRSRLLPRREPPLDGHRLAILRHREVDREVRKVLEELTARALDRDLPALDLARDAVRHLHAVLFLDELLRNHNRHQTHTPRSASSHTVMSAGQGAERRRTGSAPTQARAGCQPSGGARLRRGAPSAVDAGRTAGARVRAGRARAGRSGRSSARRATRAKEPLTMTNRKVPPARGHGSWPFAFTPGRPSSHPRVTTTPPNQKRCGKTTVGVVVAPLRTES